MSCAVANVMRDIENGIVNPVTDLRLDLAQTEQNNADQRINVLEEKIEKLESALLKLLKEKEEKLEKEKSAELQNCKDKKEESVGAKAVSTEPELNDQEKCLPENWTRRWQWRRKNDTKQGEEYINIGSPYQGVDTTSRDWVSLVHDEDVNGTPARILIRHPKIQARLRDIDNFATFEEVRLNLDSIEISSPFSPLFHHIGSVKKEIEANPTFTPADKADMHALSMFCNQGPIGSMFEDIRRLIDEGLITAEHQWALFRPGMHVVTQTLGQYEVFRVKSIQIEEPKTYAMILKKVPGNRYLVCTQIAWSGKTFGQRKREISLQKFPGARRIVDLDVCPLERFSESQREAIREQCISRGKKWKELCQSPTAIPRDCDTHCLPLMAEAKSYWDPFEGKEKRSEPLETQISGRVIVDPDASAKASKLGTMTETFTLSISELNPFTDGSYATEDLQSQYLICPALIEAFHLADHVWYRVPVPNLKHPEWMTDPWDQLELSTHYKERLKDLVNAHTDQIERTGDFIKNKGRGLVFLFHGQPGLGKTLTAEALSELIERPLYRVNIGLLAAKRDWEPDLERIFRDAHSWQAVLLLDEAEVIMEARTKDRMEQNSWCSAFLRKLEYYEGILILTTNMIHSIDKAFRSRINIAIHYEDLTFSQKKKLWKLFLSKLNPERAKMGELLKKVDEWAKMPFNGRQIRNVVLTAESLALGKNKYLEMDPDHIETIIKDTVQFNEAIDREKRSNGMRVGGVPREWG